jgi:hypothetical protein
MERQGDGARRWAGAGFDLDAGRPVVFWMSPGREERTSWLRSARLVPAGGAPRSGSLARLSRVELGPVLILVVSLGLLLCAVAGRVC